MKAKKKTVGTRGEKKGGPKNPPKVGDETAKESNKERRREIGVIVHEGGIRGECPLVFKETSRKNTGDIDRASQKRNIIGIRRRPIPSY